MATTSAAAVAAQPKVRLQQDIRLLSSYLLLQTVKNTGEGTVSTAEKGETQNP
jgi:hypothetical protein